MCRCTALRDCRPDLDVDTRACYLAMTLQKLGVRSIRYPQIRRTGILYTICPTEALALPNNMQIPLQAGPNVITWTSPQARASPADCAFMTSWQSQQSLTQCRACISLKHQVPSPPGS